MTDAVGIGLQQKTGSRVLILNKSGCLSYMERFIEKDIKISYTLDNLKIFGDNLQVEHINTYATQINSELYMIAGARIDSAITREGKDFDALLIDRCLEGFDIVVVDLSTGVRNDNRLYLEQADHILAVITPNDIMLKELFGSPYHKEACEHFSGKKKTTVIINKLYDGWNFERQLERFQKIYGFERLIGVVYNGEVLAASCHNQNLYSFLSGSSSCDNAFVQQISELCGEMIDILGLELLKQEKRNPFLGRLFGYKYSQFGVRT